VRHNKISHPMTDSGQSLQILAHRKLLHVAICPKRRKVRALARPQRSRKRGSKPGRERRSDLVPAAKGA
jgi:hypothetical protein